MPEGPEAFPGTMPAGSPGRLDLRPEQTDPAHDRKTRRAALADSPSIVRPRSGGSRRNDAGLAAWTDLGHAARTSRKARIQLMDAGDRGDRQ